MTECHEFGLMKREINRYKVRGMISEFVYEWCCVLKVKVEGYDFKDVVNGILRRWFIVTGFINCVEINF